MITSKYDEQTAMDLVGRRVRYRPPHGEAKTELIVGAVLTSRDIVMRTETGVELHFPEVPVILGKFSQNALNPSMASAT